MGRGRSDTCKREALGRGQPRVRPKRGLCGGGWEQTSEPCTLRDSGHLSHLTLPHCAAAQCDPAPADEFCDHRPIHLPTCVSLEHAGHAGDMKDLLKGRRALWAWGDLDPRSLPSSHYCYLRPGFRGPFNQRREHESVCFREGKEGGAGEMGLHCSCSGKPRWHKGGSTGHVDRRPVAGQAGNVGGEHGHEPTASSCGPSGGKRGHLDHTRSALARGLDGEFPRAVGFIVVSGH